MLKPIINLKVNTGIVGRCENVTRFFRDIRKYKPMSKDEEVKWFTMYANGTPQEKEKARNRIISCNQGLVFAAAKKWANEDNLLDYTNEANFGLMEAIDTFDLSMGVKFDSYAIYHIRRAINKYHNGGANLIKKTNHCKTVYTTARLTEEFVKKNFRQPTPEELQEMMNERTSGKVVNSSDLYKLKITHIDNGYENGRGNEEADSDITEYYEATSSRNDHERTEAEEFNKHLVTSLLSTLTEREQILIKMRFGLIDHDGFKKEYDLKEVAKALKLTKERVRQMELEIIEKLKAEYKKRLNGKKRKIGKKS